MNLQKLFRGLAFPGLCLSLCLGLFSSQAGAADSFPLFCRGGGHQLVEFATNGGSGTYFLNFLRGTAPYDGNVNHQLPGECRWADRAFFANEPNWLVVRAGVDQQFTISYFQGASTPSISSVAAPWIRSWPNTTAVIQLHVFNDNSGSMVVTSSP